MSSNHLPLIKSDSVEAQPPPSSPSQSMRRTASHPEKVSSSCNSGMERPALSTYNLHGSGGLTLTTHPGIWLSSTVIIYLFGVNAALSSACIYCSYTSQYSLYDLISHTCCCLIPGIESRYTDQQIRPSASPFGIDHQD